VIGKIKTMEEREKSICCEMGVKGIHLCMISAPMNFLLPAGGCCFFASVGKRMRKSVMHDYKIAEDAQLDAMLCKVPATLAGKENEKHILSKFCSLF
jgi:hypothetical protein